MAETNTLAPAPVGTQFKTSRILAGSAMLALCGVGLVAQSATLQPTFARAANSPFAVGNDPRAIATGDLNGDGKPDLAIVNTAPHTVTVKLGDGAGGFSAVGSPIDTKGVYPTCITVADVNGDGKPDALVGNYRSDQLSILLGDGSGGLAHAPGSPKKLDGYGPGGIAVGDVNGDGHPDLVVADTFSYTSSFKASILLGDSTGAFTFAATSPKVLGGSYPTSIVLVDVNADGELDLATANSGSNNVSVLLGNGNAGFTAVNLGTAATRSPFGTRGTFPNTVKVVDANADGKPDLVTSNFYSSNLSLLLGNGNGSFATATLLSNGSRAPSGLAVGDLNGDTILDLATSNWNDNVSVLLGDGSGSFAQATNSPFAADGDYPLAVAIADLNGDGRPDITTANTYSYDATVLLNTTPFSDSTPPMGTPLAVGTSGASNGQAYVPVRLQDAGSGVKKVELTSNSSNVHLEYPLGTPVASPLILPSPLADVTVYGVKNTNAKSRVELRLTDAAGNVAVVDPIVATLELKKNGQLTRTFKQIPQAERYVRLQNGTPGFKNARLWFNGKVVSKGGLADGQVVDLDVVEWLKPGNRNTAKITASGPKGATAILTVGDVATGAANLRASSRFNLEFSR